MFEVIRFLPLTIKKFRRNEGLLCGQCENFHRLTKFR